MDRLIISNLLDTQLAFGSRFEKKKTVCVQPCSLTSALATRFLEKYRQTVNSLASLCS